MKKDKIHHELRFYKSDGEGAFEYCNSTFYDDEYEAMEALDEYDGPLYPELWIYKEEALEIDEPLEWNAEITFKHNVGEYFQMTEEHYNLINQEGEAEARAEAKELNETFISIQDILRNADEWSLLTEVVYTALKYIQDNPDLGIVEALECAQIDWDL